MPRLVGLDLDGTLIDSAPDLSDALGAALQSVGLAPCSEAETRGWIGDGIEALIGRALDQGFGRAPTEAEQRHALSAFDARYRVHSFDRSVVYPGVPETVAALRDAGLVCICITNKRLAFAEPMLEAAGLRGLLDAVYGGDSLPRKKPFPDQLIAAASAHGIPGEDAVMIGDSPNDLDAAAAAGWQFVYARYGYTSAMQARRLAPEPAIDHFESLPALLRPTP